MQQLNDSKPHLFKNLKYDIPAGIVVFLVALPLCLGISIASGAEPFTGVLAGIVGGIVVGILSQSSLGVSGPAAGIATLISNILEQEHITYETFLIIGLIAGILQIIFGYIKAGVIANYFPSNVIKGMLAAIGIIIILKQIPHALGDDRDTEGDLDYSQADGENTFTELWNAFSEPHMGAVIITLISLAILILWKTKFFEKNKILKAMPAPLVVVIIGVIINEYIYVDGSNLDLREKHLVNIPVSKSLGDFFTSLNHPNFSVFTEKLEHYNTLSDQYIDLFIMGFKLAVVISLQTLLSAEASDKLDPYKRITPPNRELIAQGVGNSISALIGGLPLTQVIIRSSANINSGGKTKISTIFHGVLLLLAALFIPTQLNKIPLASLAAILFMIGYRLANINLFKSMFRLGIRHYLPFVITILTILFTDLLVGVLVGLIVSIFFILQNSRKNEPFDVRVKRMPDGPFKYKVKIKLHEEVTYLSKHILLLSLHDVPDNSQIIIDGRETRFISQDILEEIKEFKDHTAKARNIEVELKEREMQVYEIDESVIDKASAG